MAAATHLPSKSGRKHTVLRKGVCLDQGCLSQVPELLQSLHQEELISRTSPKAVYTEAPSFTVLSPFPDSEGRAGRGNTP